MVFSYFRVRRPREEAMARYGRWIGSTEVMPPRLTRERDKIDHATENDTWLGLSVFIYSSGEWTVFEEISGGLDMRSATDWLALADGADLVYAGCNDAIGYAYLVVIQDGRLVRHCIYDDDDPTGNVDVGRLPEEADEPFADWTDVTRWVEEDEAKLVHSEEGWLWIHSQL